MEKEPILIEKIVPGGEALGQFKNGKKIFFWNALPGEEVIEYNVVKNKSRYIKAIATKFKNQSNYRLEPKDNCFLSTSPWQIFDYNYELEMKQNLVVECFREQDISIEKPVIFTDYKDYYYRNKMEYALYWNNEKNIIELAFYERGSHRKIPIQNSSIEKPEILGKAKNIIKELNNRHEEARKFQSLILRCNQKGEVSGGLYENNKPHPIFNNLKDQILEKIYHYSPNGFFQINLPVYEMVLKEIKNHITTSNVLDLYAGVGTIGLSVASDKNLTLVECDKSAYNELIKNCDNIVSEHLNAVLAKTEDALTFIQPNQTVILDPPRAGIDKKVIERLLETKPKNIVYLSCSPITQARDIKELLKDYQIKLVKTYNFFPHTPHIENLVVLSL